MSLDDNSSLQAGLNLFTTNVAIDWKKDNIRCTVIHPGHVQTNLGTYDAPLTVHI